MPAFVKMACMFRDVLRLHASLSIFKNVPFGYEPIRNGVIIVNSKVSFRNVDICKRSLSFSCSKAVDTHQDFAVNPDSFGSLAEKNNVRVFKYPTTDYFTDMETYGPLKPKKPAVWYVAVCKAHAKAGKIERCVETLQERMLQKDKVAPLEENFTVVIGALGRVGDVSRAFSFYKRLKEYGLTPSLPCYTALANAVANSSGQSDMERLIRLREEIKRKNVILNRIVYNAIMKAYAKRGSLSETMDIFRESIAAGFEPDESTFSVLLLSCEKDKEAGFRHALQIWRQMTGLGVKPDGMIINHFLRVVRNCGIGDVATANALLLQNSSENPDFQGFVKKNIRTFRWLKGQDSSPNPDNIAAQPRAKEMLRLNQVEKDPQTLSNNTHDATSHQSCNEWQRDFIEARKYPTASNLADSATGSKLEAFNSSQAVVPSSQLSVLNLFLGDKSKEIVTLTDCAHPHDRLNLIGGYQCILHLMKQEDISPSVKIFTLLAEILEPTYQLENELMEAARKSKVKLDIDFYNCLLRKRMMRRAFNEGQEILEHLARRRIKPNYRTWCIYAMSKTNYRDGKRFLEELSEKGVETSTVLINTMISAALRGLTMRKAVGYEKVYYPDYKYLTFLISKLSDDKIPANHQLIATLESAAAWPVGYKRWSKPDMRLEKGIFFFRKAYNAWLKEVEVGDERALPDPKSAAPHIPSAQENPQVLLNE